MLPAQTITPGLTPTLVLPPPATLFAARSARFEALARGHSLAAWLQWLAALAVAQQDALDNLPDFILPHTTASLPLQAASRALREALPHVYGELAAAMARRGGAPLGRLSAADVDAKAATALDFAAGLATAAAASPDDLLVGAAIQVVWAGAARQLDRPQPAAVGKACPCCGHLPIGSVVLAGEGKGGLRYLECSVCATRWNAIRALCTLCESGKPVGYHMLEGSSGAVRAEGCDDCHGYIKTCFQTVDPHVDPVADDLATLALDTLIGEQGFVRGAPNLLLAAAELG